MQLLNELLQPFQPISLDEMNAVKLMNRIDTKYLTTIDRLPGLFTELQTNYSIQEIHSNRVAPYQTLYYDTQDVQMYLAHHNGKLNRQKLRARIYEATQQAFCEIKNKNNNKRTKKKRISIQPDQWTTMLRDETVRDFVIAKLHYEVNTLKPQVQNAFNRITLVNAQKTERLTIDMDLRFSNVFTGLSAQLPDLVIMELKQDGNYASFFKQIMLEQRIHPYRISKYCLGTILTRPQVKYNRFKNKLRYIDKLTHTTEPLLTSQILVQC